MDNMKCMEEWVLQNHDIIEKAVEIIGLSCEVLVSTVGELYPILKLVIVGSAMLLNNPEGSKAKSLAGQLDRVNKKLAAIQNESHNICLEMQRIAKNMQNFDYEVRIISQYEEFMEFVNAEPISKDKKKESFISHYESTNEDHNLDALYNAVTGKAMCKEPMLDTLVTTEQGSRRSVEKFCAGLKRLFIMGIIPVMGYSALKEGSVEIDLVEKWQNQLECVEKRMKAAVDDCKNNFAIQAKKDVKRLLQEKQGSIDQTFTQSLLEDLKIKYDWVSWSLLVIKEKTGIWSNKQAGETYHGHCGGENFFYLTEEKKELVVSFSADPKLISRREVLKKIERQKKRKDMAAVAQNLCDDLPDCLVHAISHHKDVVELNNFQEEHYYFGKHGNAHVCIHSK